MFESTGEGYAIAFCSRSREICVVEIWSLRFLVCCVPVIVGSTVDISDGGKPSSWGAGASQFRRGLLNRRSVPEILFS